MYDCRKDFPDSDFASRNREIPFPGGNGNPGVFGVGFELLVPDPEGSSASQPGTATPVGGFATKILISENRGTIASVMDVLLEQILRGLLGHPNSSVVGVIIVASVSVFGLWLKFTQEKNRLQQEADNQRSVANQTATDALLRTYQNQVEQYQHQLETISAAFDEQRRNFESRIADFQMETRELRLNVDRLVAAFSQFQVCATELVIRLQIYDDNVAKMVKAQIDDIIASVKGITDTPQ